MLRTRGPSGTVEIDGFNYDWELLSEAVLEFPTPKRLLRGLPKGRSHINDAVAARGVRAALAGGWNPGSRGKTLTFMVDANGD